MCETLWMPPLPPNQTLTSLLYFFLTQENKLVIIYCHDVKDDHLFTRCSRCPPACLCVHERSVDSMTEWEAVMKIMMTIISGVSVLSLQC